MIPTKTLRERLTEAVKNVMLGFEPDEAFWDDAAIVNACIQAIGDPCLIKTADSLEPTFTLRAQDLTADERVDDWADRVERAWYDPSPAILQKIEEARACAAAMRAWPTRKMPD